MNNGNVSTLPSEADGAKSSELVTDLDRVRAEERARLEQLARLEERARAEEIFSLYQHTPALLSITWREAIEVIKKRWLFLLIGLVVGVELAMLVLAITTPLYSVSSQVVITRQDPGQLIDTDSGSSAFIATQAEVLHSPTVVKSAVERLPRPSFLGPDADPVAVALDSVNASAISGTRVIALAYMGADPTYGASLLNTIMEVYLEEVRGSTRSDQDILLESREAELAELQEGIVQRDAMIKELRQESAVIGPADEAAAVQAAVVDDNVRALMDARNRRIELQSRLAAGGSRAISDDPMRASLREDLRLAETELAKVRSSLTAEHPSVLAAKRNVKALRAQLVSLGGTRGGLRQQIDEAERLEAEMSAIEKRSRKRLAEIELHRRKENKLLLESVRMQEQADQWQRELLNQRLVSRLAKTGDVGIGARMIEQPTIPEKAVWPKRNLMLAAGGALGLLLGFGLGLYSMRKRRDSEAVSW